MSEVLMSETLLAAVNEIVEKFSSDVYRGFIIHQENVTILFNNITVYVTIKDDGPSITCGQAM